ncbi:hypothetical protein H9635_05570 [Solibacillus sp. A46]|uniref:DUF4825 domain-containing protein n=1 Tax=Solibacillus faecavium TaxID=2762221 RepID=A0ABR8XWK1_9BACL|nr:hypothetical protein [Solibacillus faecavium]MBD8036204.1 hypothetical protein [Solibacillus faecavium]
MKRKHILIVIIVILVGVLGLKFMIDNKTYSANKILGNPDFSAVNREMEVIKIKHNPLELITIEIPAEQQKLLIESFKNLSFKKNKDSQIEYHYRINFSLNSNFAFYIDVDKGIIVLSDKNQKFGIINDVNFLENFKEIIENEKEVINSN